MFSHLHAGFDAQTYNTQTTGVSPSSILALYLTFRKKLWKQDVLQEARKISSWAMNKLIVNYILPVNDLWLEEGIFL